MGFSSLADLIRIAYRVKAYQVQGPDWMSQQRFEIQAKIPEGAAEDKVPEMLQALLAERFKLVIHRDRKELPVYALIVGKNGPKLTLASEKPDAPLPDSPGAISIGTEKGQMKMVQDGKGGVTMQGGGAIFNAMEKLGLKLDARKAPVETIVVDHLEKTPTEN